MVENVKEIKNESSTRRRFFRKLVGLAAMAGIGGGSLGGSIRKVYGADTNSLYIGQANTGSSETSLTASPAGTAFKVETATTAINSQAIYGYASASTNNTCGVFGQSNSVDGMGVYGFAYASTGHTYGVWGFSKSVNGRGVFGKASASTGTNYGVYGASDSSSGISVMGGADNAGAKPMVARGYSGQTANLQEWQNSSSTALSVVDKDGYFGIGTSSPSTAVHVKSSSSNPAIKIENENAYVGEFIYCYSNSHMPFFSGRRARGNTASPSAVLSGDELMRYGGSGYGSTGFPGGNRALLKFFASEDWTDADQGTYITMETTPMGSTTAAERLRVTSNGSVVPGSDNSGSIGIASKRWADLYVVNLHQGDLIFQNGYKVTEDETDGLAFLNKSGQKIAVLDDEGNLRVKGKVIEGL